MESNKIDRIVRETLKSRTIKPSGSAWERLSDQLDQQEESPIRLNWFKYAGYAASVLLIISVAFFINTNDGSDPVKTNDIVVAPEIESVIDSSKLVRPSFKNTVPQETVIVKKNVLPKAKKVNKEPLKQVLVLKKRTELKEPAVFNEQSKIVIAANTSAVKQGEKKEVNRIVVDSEALLMAVTKQEKKSENAAVKVVKKSAKNSFSKSRIQIHSDALLYAVTNPNKDINEYYKKYHINRDEVLRDIQKELQKAHLSIDAQTLLTSVEKSIDEETFKKSFMQVVKGKISGLATAFANRNN